MLGFVSMIVEVVAGVAFMSSVGLVVVSVVLRVFKVASPWADEGACWLFIWTVFLAAAVALRRDVHIRIDVLLIRLPQGFKEVLLFVLDVFCLVFCVGLLYGVYQIIRAISYMRSPAMELPLIYFYLPLFIGFMLMIIYLAVNILDFIQSRAGESGGG